jgi:Tfp pilus assembly protein PilX
VIRNVLASKKGASSILVIMLLVVLMVFGIAALTTALSSMRLTQKVTDWNAQYYAAEAVAWERCAQIDRAAKAALAGPDAEGTDVEEALSALDFDTQAEAAETGLRIRYEAWSDDGSVGISAALSFDVSDGSLRVVQWQEIQREGKT